LFFLPQFLQVAQGSGPLVAGLQLLPWTATLFVFAPIGGVLVNRLGERLLVVLGLLLQAAGFAWIALIAVPGLGYTSLVAPLIVAGAGVSLAMPAAQNAVLSAVAPGEIGKASGIFNMWRFLGGVFGVAIQVAAFATTGSVGSADMFSSGFTTAIGLAAALSLIAGLVGTWLPGRHAGALAAATAKA
jgi:MFS family permease